MLDVDQWPELQCRWNYLATGQVVVLRRVELKASAICTIL